MINAAAGAPIVVGVDGSEHSQVAVRLAVRLAATRHRPVRVVHAYSWPVVDLPRTVPPVMPWPGGSPEAVADLRAHAEDVVAQAQAYARQRDPNVAVSGDAVLGPAAPVLIEASSAAAMVVLGSRGRGGFAALLLGSVAVQVAAHASGPVVIARGTERDTGPVVVGVDGWPTSAQAIAFAAQEAAFRDATLVAVHAWTSPVSAGPGDMLPLVYDTEQVTAEETRVLAESVAGLADRHPDLRVEQQVVREPSTKALVERSRQAQLVVVGSRGRGGFAGLLLGSVSQALIHHADCPVIVVRPHQHGRALLHPGH